MRSGQRRPFDVFGDNVDRECLITVHVVNGNDVGMIESSYDAGFVKIGLRVFRPQDEMALGPLMATRRCNTSS